MIADRDMCISCHTFFKRVTELNLDSACGSGKKALFCHSFKDKPHARTDSGRGVLKYVYISPCRNVGTSHLADSV